GGLPEGAAARPEQRPVPWAGVHEAFPDPVGLEGREKNLETAEREEAGGLTGTVGPGGPPRNAAGAGQGKPARAGRHGQRLGEPAQVAVDLGWADRARSETGVAVAALLSHPPPGQASLAATAGSSDSASPHGRPRPGPGGDLAGKPELGPGGPQPPNTPKQVRASLLREQAHFLPAVSCRTVAVGTGCPPPSRSSSPASWASLSTTGSSWST